jgi:hypothetical protein
VIEAPLKLLAQLARSFDHVRVAAPWASHSRKIDDIDVSELISYPHREFSRTGRST